MIDLTYLSLNPRHTLDVDLFPPPPPPLPPSDILRRHVFTLRPSYRHLSVFDRRDLIDHVKN